jgi:hypothetical protein
MTTPLPHDHYDRKLTGRAASVRAEPGRTRPNTEARLVKGFLSYDRKLAEGRRLILAAVVHATSMGLALHNINLTEDAEKNEASFRYTVEGDEVAIAVFTEALAAV